MTHPGWPRLLGRRWPLRRMGFHIGLDGFGAGHAGLASLRSIPADYPKIHRSLIDEVATSEEVRSSSTRSSRWPTDWVAQSSPRGWKHRRRSMLYDGSV